MQTHKTTGQSWEVAPSYLIWRRTLDRVMRIALFIPAALSVFITTAIVVILITESWGFFAKVSIIDFLTDTQWTPVFAEPRFGILPLLTATFWTTGIALTVALPLGALLTIYLSEYASDTTRETIKPTLELLAGIPTVVYGYFALLFLTPLLQTLIPELGGLNLLVPGIVLGIMILPTVVSISEDAMRAVPASLREGGYALGMTRWQVALRVVVPGALSGIIAAYLLGMSRAIGETMVLAIAAGQNPNLTSNPLEGAATITAYIVQMSLGDLPHGSLPYQSIFAVGLTLFVITLLFNIAGFLLQRRFRESY
jgi:phosphate transport system permease protein